MSKNRKYYRCEIVEQHYQDTCKTFEITHDFSCCFKSLTRVSYEVMSTRRSDAAKKERTISRSASSIVIIALQNILVRIFITSIPAAHCCFHACVHGSVVAALHRHWQEKSRQKFERCDDEQSSAVWQIAADKSFACREGFLHRRRLCPAISVDVCKLQRTLPIRYSSIVHLNYHSYLNWKRKRKHSHTLAPLPAAHIILSLPFHAASILALSDLLRF